eukprot:g30770.t1
MSSELLAAHLQVKTRGFEGKLDFLYLPWSKKEGKNEGYCILSFVDGRDAQDFFLEPTEGPPASSKSLSVCEVPNIQGLKALHGEFGHLSNQDPEYDPLFLRQVAAKPRTHLPQADFEAHGESACRESKMIQVAKLIVLAVEPVSRQDRHEHEQAIPTDIGELCGIGEASSTSTVAFELYSRRASADQQRRVVEQPPPRSKPPGQGVKYLRRTNKPPEMPSWSLRFYKPEMLPRVSGWRRELALQMEAPCVIEPCSYLVAFSGVLTLRFRGFPPQLIRLKEQVRDSYGGLAKEGPGSLWPKSTLGALADGKRLDREALKVLQQLCAEGEKRLQSLALKLPIDVLSLVFYECRSLERRLMTSPLPLAKDGVRDTAPPVEEDLRRSLRTQEARRTSNLLAMAWTSRCVTFISPCPAKGLCIFLRVAKSLPSLHFLAVPTQWTKSIHLTALRDVANVEIMEGHHVVEDVYARTAVLLVPSLWSEAFGLVAMEAQLRGIPVVSSDHYGLREANMCEDLRVPKVPLDMRMRTLHRGQTIEELEEALPPMRQEPRFTEEELLRNLAQTHLYIATPQEAAGFTSRVERLMTEKSWRREKGKEAL